MGGRIIDLAERFLAPDGDGAALLEQLGAGDRPEVLLLGRLMHSSEIVSLLRPLASTVPQTVSPEHPLADAELQMTQCATSQLSSVLLAPAARGRARFRHARESRTPVLARRPGGSKSVPARERAGIT